MNDVIRFESVSKRFVLHRERARSFQDLALHLLQRRNGSREVFWAIKDVSFRVARGEFLGLVGPNGAGKSTILKLITRILEPSGGAISTRGRVAALLELGTGFHPDLTGRENIYLNGSLMGFSRRQIHQRIDSIISFAGIERFVDTPVRHYSSGMYMRLGFAVAVHSDPDILITDEVLAVGDEAFQNKCLQRMREFREAGVTILLVSHNLPIVRRLCDRVLWLEQGSIVLDGAPNDVIDAYVEQVAAEERAAQVSGAPPRLATPSVADLGDARLLGAELLGPDGRPRWSVQAGEKMRLRVHYQARRSVPGAVVTATLSDREERTPICSTSSYQLGMLGTVKPGVGALELPNLMLPLRRGAYQLSLSLYHMPDPPLWAHPDDVQHNAYTLVVDSPYSGPPIRWGSGEIVLDDVQVLGAQGRPTSTVATGDPLRLQFHLSGDTSLPAIVRVQIHRREDWLLCHGTNTGRAGLSLAEASAGLLCLAYEQLPLLAGEYVISAGVWPDEASITPYDWHQAAYPLTVTSARDLGVGLAAIPHRWLAGPTTGQSDLS